MFFQEFPQFVETVRTNLHIVIEEHRIGTAAVGHSHIAFVGRAIFREELSDPSIHKSRIGRHHNYTKVDTLAGEDTLQASLN